MSNREDYLDSLLKSMTGPGENDGDEAVKSQTEDWEEPKPGQKKSISPEDEFLMDFDKDFKDFDEDEFLKEFEQELSGTSFLDEKEPKPVSTGQKSAKEDDFMVNTMEEEPSAADAPGMDDIDAMLQAAMGQSEKKAQDIPEPVVKESNQEQKDEDLMGLLSGMEDNDDLADIGNMLKAHDSDTKLEDDGFEDLLGDMDDFEELGPDSGQSVEPGYEDLANGVLPGEKKGKKDKKKKSKENGFFHRLSSLLFEERDAGGEVAEAGELGSISDENMELLKELDKKERKEQRKREKQEKKAAKPRKEKKVKPPRPPKEKPPKEKSKPLPKAPVVLICVMAASVLLLVLLGSRFSGYNTGLSEAQESFDEGDYVGAYQLLAGMDLKEKDLEFFDKARIAAYLQKEWDSYQAYISKTMYPEALDALISAVGKYDKYIDEAIEIGAGGELEGIRTQVEQALTETFGVTMEEAQSVYAELARENYTARLYELLKRVGLSE